MPEGDLILVFFDTQTRKNWNRDSGIFSGLTSGCQEVRDSGGTSCREMRPWKSSGGPDSGNEDRGNFGWATVGPWKSSRGRGKPWELPWEIQETGRRTGAGGQVRPRRRLREKNYKKGTDMRFRLENEKYFVRLNAN